MLCLLIFSKPDLVIITNKCYNLFRIHYSTAVHSLCVDWRKSLRMLWCVHPMTNCDIIAALSNQLPLHMNLEKRFTTFIKKCLSSTNSVVNIISNIAICNPMSTAGKNYRSVLDVNGQYNNNQLIHDWNLTSRSKRVQPTRGWTVAAQRSTNCTHSSCPPQWGPVSTVFWAGRPSGPAGWLALLLLKAGDVETNPGPKHTRTQVWICDICHREITRKQTSLRCNHSEHWVHLRCAHIRVDQYTDTWICHLHRGSRLPHATYTSPHFPLASSKPLLHSPPTPPTPPHPKHQHTSNSPTSPLK